MPEKTRATLGGCQRFECRVIGYPRPTIQWFKDGRDITNDNRYEFDYSVDGIITMVICNVTEKDQGVYSCRAENSEGWAATAAFLNVRGRDLFHFFADHFRAMWLRALSPYVASPVTSPFNSATIIYVTNVASRRRALTVAMLAIPDFPVLNG